MNWLANLAFELTSLFSHANTRMTVLVAAIGYAILYPLPYFNQLPNDVPMAAVDYDQSKASRKLLRMLDATPQLSLKTVLTSEIEARSLLEAQQVRGFIVIPADFNQRLKRRIRTTIAYAGDGAYYLLYATQAEGVMASVVAFNEVYSESLQVESAPAVLNESTQPFDLALMNAFNPELGYRNYVIPGVFLLILHQLAIMGMATMTWVQGRRGDVQNRYRGNWWQETSARVGAFLLVFLVLSAVYFYALLPFYRVPTAPFEWGLIGYLVVFFVATLMLGQLFGRVAEHPQMVVVVVIFSSLPLVFTAGFIWPVESIPSLWYHLMSVLPATTGISAFLEQHLYHVSVSNVGYELSLLATIAVVSGIADYWAHRKVSIADGQGSLAPETHEG